ncbi:uncharacterized protein CEXT_298111 [Caerostris extrusa]|uniref:LAGLIDADG homing endonuclease n=1 Tax=Caerostris extrusa TaxID=172846 RepID=A0AAV4XPJ9_CAEEX|nr:uncharacterized protein CEXT_298111 [Caerostris extrusa]
MEYVIGSFFTKDDMPQYCYTLYSLWGNPYKKRERGFPRGQKAAAKGMILLFSAMKLHFNLNSTQRDNEITVGGYTAWYPKHNLPTTPSVQIAIHTPYFLPSPYVLGSGYQGGKAYELRVFMEFRTAYKLDIYGTLGGIRNRGPPMLNSKLEETHLLPSPYQTNCTDYLKEWRERGGKGPLISLRNDGAQSEQILLQANRLIKSWDRYISSPVLR